MESKASKDRLIHLLEFEIKRIQTDEAKPGWTQWALAAAIASLTWLFLVDITGLPINIYFYERAMLIVAVWLSVQSLILLAFILSPQRSRVSHRFWYADKLLPAARLRMLAELAWIVFISVIFYTSVDSFTTVAFWFVFFQLLFDALQALVCVVLSYLSVPFSLALGGKRGFSTMLLIHAVVRVASFIALCAILNSTPSSMSVPHIRAALIICCGMLLIFHFLDLREGSPLLDTLVDLRRRLGLGEIEEASARKEFEIALSGLKASDILRNQIEALLSKHRTILLLHKEILTALNGLQDVVPKTRPILCEHQSMVHAVLQTLESKVSQSGNLLNRLEDDLKRFRQSTQAHARLFPTWQADISNFVAEFEKKSSGMVPDQRKELATLQERIRDWQHKLTNRDLNA